MEIVRYLSVIVILAAYTFLGFQLTRYSYFAVSMTALFTIVIMAIDRFHPFRNRDFIRHSLGLLALAMTLTVFFEYSQSGLNGVFIYPILSIVLLFGIMFTSVAMLIAYYGVVAACYGVLFMVHRGQLALHGDFIMNALLLGFILLFYIPLLIQRRRAEDRLKISVEEKTRELQTINRSLESMVDRSVLELRNKDAILIQQGKLSAMGEMMANIAHQWKQPLNSLGITVQNLKDYYDRGILDNEFMNKSVARSLLLIQHMARTVEDFRNFYKPDKEKSVFYLQDAAERTIAIIDDSFKNNHIDIDLEAEHGLKIEGFPGEFSQVVLNILANAKDACVAAKMNGAFVKIRIFRENGNFVTTISNNAGNIDDKVLPRLFEAYFTTKESGSGIGLYMTKMIVEKSMGGRISAKNIPNGAEFRIEIPMDIIHLD